MKKILESKLHPNAKILFIYLLHHPEGLRISLKTLASNLNYTKPTIRKAISELEELKAISVNRKTDKRRNDSNFYSLTNLSKIFYE